MQYTLETEVSVCDCLSISELFMRMVLKSRGEIFTIGNPTLDQVMVRIIESPVNGYPDNQVSIVQAIHGTIKLVTVSQMPF